MIIRSISNKYHYYFFPSIKLSGLLVPECDFAWLDIDRFESSKTSRNGFLGRENSGNGKRHPGRVLCVSGLGDDGEGVVHEGPQVADRDGVRVRRVL